jgi:hypothetical protein
MHFLLKIRSREVTWLNPGPVWAWPLDLDYQNGHPEELTQQRQNLPVHVKQPRQPIPVDI